MSFKDTYNKTIKDLSKKVCTDGTPEQQLWDAEVAGLRRSILGGFTRELDALERFDEAAIYKALITGISGAVVTYVQSHEAVAAALKEPAHD